jgi:hypothetical protein
MAQLIADPEKTQLVVFSIRERSNASLASGGRGVVKGGSVGSQ